MTNSKKSYRTALLSLFATTKTVAAVTFSAFKQKGLSLIGLIFLFFTDTMKVKKGRRLVRSSVMLKRTAAMVPRAIKAGLSCNWCCVEPVALLATLDLIPPESENHVTGSTGERVTTRGSSRVALHTAKLL